MDIFTKTIGTHIDNLPIKMRLDEHIFNSDNAHFGQNLTCHGNPTFNTMRIIDTILPSHAVSKQYVDNKILGLVWLKEVDFIGENYDVNYHGRYLCDCDKLTDDGEIIRKKDHIYTYNKLSNQWSDLVPSYNNAIYVIKDNINLVYNGIEWVRFGCWKSESEIIYTNNPKEIHTSPADKLCDDMIPYVNVLKNVHIGEGFLPSIIEDNSNLTITGNNDKLNISYIYANSFTNDPINTFYMRASGDIYNPKNLSENTSIGSLIFAGHDGTTYKATSSIHCSTTQEFKHDGCGSALHFATTENDTTIPKIRLTIDNDGTIYCKNNKEHSLIVDGGTLINNSLQIGGEMTIKSDVKFDNSNNKICFHSDTQDGRDKHIIELRGGGGKSNSRGSSVIVSGTDSIMDGSLQLNAGYPNGTIELVTDNKPQMTIDKLGKISINNSTSSSSIDSGCLVLMGGLGVKENITMGSVISMNGTDNIIRVSDGDHNTSQLSMCGGKKSSPSCGGYIKLFGNEYVKKDDSLDNMNKKGSIIINTGNVGVNGNSENGRLYFMSGFDDESDNYNCIVDENGIWNILSSYDSTSVTSGSLIVKGGVGVSEQLTTKRAKINDMVCEETLKIPVKKREPMIGEEGMIYYDLNMKCVRIYTSHGWMTLSKV